jgi:chemotaxis-related protein WspB
MRVHVLHLRVGDERYALPTASVVEVVPAVPLRRVPGTPEAVAGLLAYRGRVVPVVDLPRLFGRGAAPARLSTRIAVCDRDGALAPLGVEAPQGPGGAGGGGARRRLVGVLAERVTRVGELDPDVPGSHPGPRADGLPALGRVTFDEDGLVQLVEVGELLPADLLARLEREEAEGGAR